jgi:hypothetical protein
MSIKVEVNRKKTTVETDYRDSFGSDHSGVYDSPELLGAMRSWGIEKIEVSGISDRTDVRGALRDEFDKKFKEGHGRKYFGL